MFKSGLEYEYTFQGEKIHIDFQNNPTVDLFIYSLGIDSLDDYFDNLDPDREREMFDCWIDY